MEKLRLDLSIQMDNTLYRNIEHVSPHRKVSSSGDPQAAIVICFSTSFKMIKSSFQAQARNQYKGLSYTPCPAAHYIPPIDMRQAQNGSGVSISASSKQYPCQLDNKTLLVHGLPLPRVSLNLNVSILVHALRSRACTMPMPYTCGGTGGRSVTVQGLQVSL